jgi:hypothetical protein
LAPLLQGVTKRAGHHAEVHLETSGLRNPATAAVGGPSASSNLGASGGDSTVVEQAGSRSRSAMPVVALLVRLFWLDPSSQAFMFFGCALFIEI